MTWKGETSWVVPWGPLQPPGSGLALHFERVSSPGSERIGSVDCSPVPALGLAGNPEILEWGLPGVQPGYLQHYNR